MIAIDELFRSGTVKPVPVWLDGMIQRLLPYTIHPDYLTSSLRKSLLKDDGDNPFSNEWFRPVKGREYVKTYSWTVHRVLYWRLLE